MPRNEKNEMIVMNPFLSLSGLGMMSVGLIATLWWKLKTKLPWRYFCFGSLMWVVAIAPKYAMDYTITPYVSVWLYSYGTVTALIGLGLYVGLRTGFFESGFSYVGIKRTKFRKMNLNQAIAFGVGFGSIEAILLGFMSFINIIILWIMPSLVDALPMAIQATLDMPTIVILPAIAERLFTLFIHVFASLHVVLAVVKKRMGYLWMSITFKSLVDSIIPALTHFFDISTLSGMFLVEVPIFVLAVVSYFGIKWTMRKF